MTPPGRGGAGRGQGRKPGPPGEVRRRVVAVRFTDAEYADLEAEAEAEEITVAELVRVRALAVEGRS